MSAYEDRLNAYDGDNVWQDIIVQLPDYDYDATEDASRLGGNDKFVAGGKVYEFVPSEDRWTSFDVEPAPLRLSDWSAFEQWLGNEPLDEDEIRLIFTWLENRELASTGPWGQIFVEEQRFTDNEWTNILSQAFRDMQMALQATVVPEEAEKHARRVLERLLTVYGPDYGEDSLNEEFLVPVDEEHGCYVGRDAAHGLGVSCPWYADPADLLDPYFDPTPMWVTVWADGTSDL
jgi:hypothetical protein